MKIVLVNPPSEKIVEAFDHPKYPQISIGYLASFLESKNIRCKVIDAKLERLNADETVSKCASFDLVGFTALTHEITFCAKLAELIKKISPKTKIVIGGAHATALPKETMESFEQFDFLVYGEGEQTLYELTIALENNISIGEIKGLVYRKDGIVINKPRLMEQDLDTLPPPAWHLFPKAAEYPILTARGCPFNCIFCMRAHGQKVRLRSVENVLEELKLLIDKYDAKYVRIYDETFTLFKERTKQICDGIINLGIHKKIVWDAETRVDCIDFETLQKMKLAGCVLIRLGIEAGNPKILKASKKGITLDEAEQAVKWAKKAKLRTQSLFILGHPNETKETMKETVNFAVKLNTSLVSFGIMTPYPGTEVYEIAKRGEGGYNVLSSDWKDYNKQMGNALELKSVSRGEVESIQFWGYMKFYFYNFKIKEIIENIIENRGLAFAIMQKIFNRKIQK